MKFNKKYLGIFSFILFISTIFILYEYRPKSFKEGLTTSVSTVGGGTGRGTGSNRTNVSSSSSNLPNSIIPNSVTSVISDPSQLNISTGGVSGYKVTSSNNISDTTAVSNDMNVISEGSPNCDPETTYSMKSVMQDNNGNIIVRYMDTCGKYYTYQYSQTINKIQNIVTPPPAPIEQTSPPPPPTNNFSFNIDANAINNIISSALKSAVKEADGTPTPLVLPT